MFKCHPVSYIFSENVSVVVDKLSLMSVIVV